MEMAVDAGWRAETRVAAQRVVVSRTPSTLPKALMRMPSEGVGPLQRVQEPFFVALVVSPGRRCRCAKKKGNDRANSRHFLKDVGRVVRLGRAQQTIHRTGWIPSGCIVPAGGKKRSHCQCVREVEAVLCRA